MKRKKSKSGFTLVELLVVISIIAILLAVLVPAMSKAREQAKSTVCKSRMKQFALAVNLYAENNNGLYVTQDWMFGSGGLSDPNGHWFSRLGPYIGAVKGQGHKLGAFMRCPSGQAVRDFGTENNYAYNATDYGLQKYPGGNITVRSSSGGMNTIDNTAKLVSIKQPGNFGVVFDFYFGEKSLKSRFAPNGNITDGTIEYKKWKKIVEEYSGEFKYKMFRHNKGLNIVFADSHTSYFKEPDWWKNVATPSSFYWFTDGPGKR